MKVVERARLLVNVVERYRLLVNVVERDQLLVKVVDRDQRLLVVERAQLLVWLLTVDDPCHGLWAERCVYQAEEKWVYQVQSGGQGVWCW